MKYAITTTKLTKVYEENCCVQEVDLHVPEGKIYGLLGRNGAGKTTIMRMLLNLAAPTSGSFQLFQEEPSKESYQKIGSLIEAPGFYDNLTGEENLRLLARLRGTHRRDCVEHALRVVNLENENKKVFHKYSLGMKQRLSIAAAIMHEPKLLILDEPINGLDPIGIHEIRKYLLYLSKEKNTTILISSHLLSEIEQLADYIGVIHEGKLIEEIDMSELHHRMRQFVEFEVSDVKLAALLLERNFEIFDYTVMNDKVIRVFEKEDIRGLLNQTFVEHKILVDKVNLSQEKLEDYFASLIGGGSIG